MSRDIIDFFSYGSLQGYFTFKVRRTVIVNSSPGLMPKPSATSLGITIRFCVFSFCGNVEDNSTIYFTIS